MIVGLLLFLIFALVFTMIQSLILRKQDTDSKTYAKEQLENLKKGRHFQEFVLRKQIKLKKYGADIFVRDGIGLSTLFQTNFFRLFFRYCTGV
jgi:ABC-type transport system involved in multi-copper enzyme maturation permease subunit